MEVYQRQDLVYTNVRTSEQQRFKMRIIFVKKTPGIMKLKETAPMFT